jgi:hypothetical protein
LREARQSCPAATYASVGEQECLAGYQRVLVTGNFVECDGLGLPLLLLPLLLLLLGLGLGLVEQYEAQQEVQGGRIPGCKSASWRQTPKSWFLHWGQTRAPLSETQLPHVLMTAQE